LVVRPGYKFGSTTLTATLDAAGAYASLNGTKDEQEADYSGGYILCGITVSLFDQPASETNKAAAENSGDSSELPDLDQEKAGYADLIQKGNEEFAKKSYETALGFYKDAAKISETAEVYKKIGNCCYYSGKKAAAREAFNKSLKLNPKDQKLKDWLKNYK
jgi:tetratricopeptide (TPR) repeat protein